MRCLIGLFASFATLLLPVAAAHADPIDQQNASYTYGSAANTSVGQSFTPTLNTVTFATFLLKGNGNTVVNAELLQGAGMGGTVLGTSNSLSLADCGFDYYTFNFAPITVAPGSLYTLAVDLVSGGQFQEVYSLGGYANGVAFGPSGSSYPGYDLTFNEGGHNTQVNPAIAATPEPSSLMLLGTGALGMAGVLRRKMRRA